MSLPAFLFLVRTAENRTLCRARALRKRVSVFSPRARTPAGGRSRCVFASQIRTGRLPKPVRICEANTRILRANFRLKTDAMFIESQRAMRRINGSPYPRRIELYAGRGRKENALATQTGTRFPNGGPGGKSIPESALRTGRAFPMAVQAESASRNLASNWDILSASPAASKNLRALHPKTG